MEMIDSNKIENNKNKRIKNEAEVMVLGWWNILKIWRKLKFVSWILYKVYLVILRQWIRILDMIFRFQFQSKQTNCNKDE